ncbi:hypothetical protein [Sphaerisporangium fuscum]|uniref:hypothetical protein n=1 Tax=Sphaerisporangium fuscum TaxID=2835868 RepID=UPI001BDD84DD|nr:hypothetical protein [Sphaerisporangium fuscum]
MAQKTTAAPARAKAGTTGRRASAGRAGEKSEKKETPRPEAPKEHHHRVRHHQQVVHVPLLGEVVVPPPQRLVFYAALGVLTAFEIIEWPLALVIAAGHFLAEQHTSRVLQEVGQAAEAV